jgi:ATP-binding cassette subfamily F protein 3
MTHQDGHSVLEETKTAFAEAYRLQDQLDQLSQEMAERTDYESESYSQLIDRFEKLSDQVRLMEVDSLEGRAERILKGLGFGESDFARPTDEYSGGWRMRIELAKLLLRAPDILLLDEPTNHLDIESIRWLEQFLAQRSGALVLVSHDRAFLDAVTNRTIELSRGKAIDYPVPYTQYVEQRAERRAQLQAAYENQQKEIAEKERFIERFRAQANKARQVQSRIKQLEKMERIELDEADTTQIQFRFPDAPRSGAVVVKGKQIHKNFGEKQVIKGLDFELNRGERVAFIGKNGEGKSTLLKILSGHLSADDGEVLPGHNIVPGYYAQEQSRELQGDLTVYDTLDREADAQTRPYLRDILGAFLFSGETVDKKVRVLSGGEKARVALAQLLLRPQNLLFLDEPTNHLDMQSKDVLKQALKDYQGALIVVSHDREFLHGLVDKLIEFRDGQIHVHHEDIYAFLRKRDLESLDALDTEGQKPTTSSAKANKGKNTKKGTRSSEANKESKETRKARDKEIKQAKKRIESVEKDIAQLENDIAEMEQELARMNGQVNQALFEQYDEAKHKLERKMQEWERAQAAFEQVSA